MTTTLEIVQQTKECYRTSSACLGDSGNIKCFFCPDCVISMDERVYNLRMYEIQVYNEGNKVP